MPDIGYAPKLSPSNAVRRGRQARRAALAIAIMGGATLAALATPALESAQAAQAAGAELTRLLRAMAGLKLLFASGLLALIGWRLAAPASAWRMAAYTSAAAAMAAGPVLIWHMVDVGLGALLLHAGLFGGALLLWRDPEAAVRLRDMVERRLGPLHRQT